MSDLISRQAVLKQLADRIEAAKKWHEDCVAFENETGEQASYRALMDFNEVRLMVENLPPAQPEPMWIPVTESLPNESDGIVLITVNGKVTTGQYSEFSKRWYKGDMCSVGGDDPIAWMPLPKPYERSEDE